MKLGRHKLTGEKVAIKIMSKKDLAVSLSDTNVLLRMEILNDW